MGLIRWDSCLLIRKIDPTGAMWGARTSGAGHADVNRFVFQLFVADQQPHFGVEGDTAGARKIS